MNNNCPHEDSITHGKAFGITATTRTLLVTCDTCGATGAQAEFWDDNLNDYAFLDEAWHNAPEQIAEHVHGDNS